MMLVKTLLTLAPVCVSALRLPQTSHKKLGLSSDFVDLHQTDWWPFGDDDKPDQLAKPAASETCLPRLELKKHRQLNYYSNSGSFPQNCGEHPDLCTVLKETANEKRQVIVGVLMGYMNTLPHFVESLKKSGNDKHFMLAVLDDNAKQWAIDNGIKYWHKPMQISKTHGGNITNHAVGSLKFALFQDMIKAGAKVLVSDLDVAYLSGDVFKYIYDDSDIEGMSDGWENNRAYGYDDVMDSPEMGWSRYHHSERIFHFNSGLFYMNPTQESFNLMSTLADRVSKESIWDQAAFNDEVLKPSSPTHKASDVITRVMDIECFSNSRVLFTTLRDRKPKFRPVLTHLNAHPEKAERMEDTIKHYYNGDDQSWQRWSTGSGLRGSAEENTNRAMGDALSQHFGEIPRTLSSAKSKAEGQPDMKFKVNVKKNGVMVVDRSSPNYDVQIINHFDKGYTDVYKSWVKCATEAMGAEAFKQRVHTIDTTPTSSFIQVDANPSPELKRMLYTQFLDYLKKGKNTIHVEVDAFLQRDPNVLFEMYPDADVIASIDVAGRKNSWYLGPRDNMQPTWGARGRHGGEDPFYPLGFMLNIGVAGIRPNEKTISLVEEMLQPDTMKDVEKQWCGEQVIFSEKLFFRPNCTWTFKDGTPIPMLPRESQMSEEEYQQDPVPPMWGAFGDGQTAYGNCPGPKGNLKVVALPWKYTGRDVRPFQTPDTVSHHPSGDAKSKARAGHTICDTV